ncbi:MAG TPA: thymidylate synthase, partial [Nitrospirota bacterium]
MKQHQDLMRHLLENGNIKGDRTGTGTVSDFGAMMKFSLQHGFWPIPTTREVEHEKISSELEWMLKGIISVDWLKERKNGIWNAWAGDKSGTIGPMYGEQWRNFGAAVREIAGEDEARLNKILSDAVSGEDHISISGAIEAVKAFVAEKTMLYQDGGRGGVDQLQYICDELMNNPDS